MLPAPWRAQILGHACLKRGDDVVTSFRDRTLMTLVAVISLQPDFTASRQLVLECMWPEEDPALTSNRLRVLLHRLRSILEPLGVQQGSVLISRRHEIAFNPAGFSCDAADFSVKYDAAKHLTEPADRKVLLEVAVEQISGELLPGNFSEWVVTKRNRISNQYFLALRALVQDCVATNDLERGLTFAQASIENEPLDEEAHFDLIRILGTLGRTSEALRRYEEWRKLLLLELNSEPALPIKNLYLMLRGRSGHSGVSITPPLNIARAKKSSTFETVGAVSHTKPTARRLQLPSHLTRFFGRHDEITAVRDMLSVHGNIRLATVLGPAGAGKTRISLEICANLADEYQGRVFFVPLADVVSAAQIPDSILSTLQLNSPRSSPLQATREDALSHVLAALQQAPTLVVLDNMEQLLPEARELIMEILHQAPELRCLVTSRRTIGLEGEWVYPLPPLPLPAPDATDAQIAASPAIALFADRARSSKSDFALSSRNAKEVLELCCKLEGIPLAIELAAARIGVFSIKEMNSQIGVGLDWLIDVKGGKERRHSSLRAAMEWSNRLLSPKARSVFSAISAFVGGFTSLSANAILGEHEENIYQTITVLDSLCTDSLILTNPGDTDITRFNILDSLRAYGNELLTASGREREVRLQHLRYFTALAERPEWESPEAMNVLQTEDANIRAALDFGSREGATSEEWQCAVRLARSMPEHYILRGRLPEGRLIFERLLRLPIDDNLKNPIRISAARLAILQGDYADGLQMSAASLNSSLASSNAEDIAGSHLNIGMVRFRQGDYAGAAQEFERALEYAISAENVKLQADCLVNRGVVYWYRADHAEARVKLTEATDLFRAINSRRGVADSLLKLGNVLRDTGNLDEGTELLNQASELFKSLQDTHGQALCLHDLGMISSFRGDTSLSKSQFQNALDQFQNTGFSHGVVSCISNLGRIEIDSGMWKTGSELIIQAVNSYKKLGSRRGVAECLNILSRADEGRGDCKSARANAMKALQIDREIHNRQGIALDLERIGRLQLAAGELAEARQTLIEATALTIEIGTNAGFSLLLEALAMFALISGKPEKSAMLVGKYYGLFALMNSVPPPIVRLNLDQQVAKISADIGIESCTAAQQSGSLLSLTEIANIVADL